MPKRDAGSSIDPHTTVVWPAMSDRIRHLRRAARKFVGINVCTRIKTANKTTHRKFARYEQGLRRKLQQLQPIRLTLLCLRAR